MYAQALVSLPLANLLASLAALTLTIVVELFHVETALNLTFAQTDIAYVHPQLVTNLEETADPTLMSAEEPLIVELVPTTNSAILTASASL